MKLGLRLLLLVSIVFGGIHAAAQGAFYTVQVVALSDRDGALTLVSDLLKDGFPAYVVRSSSSEGDLFRIRVGSFADRGAAVQYIEVMPEIAGGRPVPALAEGIPTGLVPAHTELKIQIPLSERPVLALADTERLLLRSELTTDNAPDHYQFYGFDANGNFQVEAYRVIPGDSDDWYILRDLALWPETVIDDSEDIRNTFRESLLSLLEERLGVTRAQLDRATIDRGSTNVVRVVERYHGVSKLAEVVSLVWFEGEERVFSDPAIGERFAEPDVPVKEVTALVPADGTAENADWFATPEGDFVRLSVNNDGVPGKSWRAATGTPLTFVFSGLLSLGDQTLYYYEFPPR